MLRLVPIKNAKDAVRYFENGLTQADYYMGKEKTIGLWGGNLKQRLELPDQVTKKDFEKLANNRNPVNSDKLNVRDSDNRRVGVEAVFSPPKSTSITYGFTGDKDIITAHNMAVESALLEMQKNIQTQAGQGKNKHYETTGNMLYSTYLHTHSRPENGVADWHIHTHAPIFNTTWNEKKQRFQAAEFSQLHYDRPYYEAFYMSHMAKNLQEAGYKIERNEKNFEIAGFTRSLIEKYSTRTNKIEKTAKELGIFHSERKANLGAQTRQSKKEVLGKYENEAALKTRVTHKEKVTILTAKGDPVDSGDSITAKQALDHAVNHHLTRQSTITEKQLWGEAIKRGHGALSPEQIKKEYLSRKDFLSKKDKRTGAITLTTEFALAEEKKLRDRSRKGQNAFAPISPNYKPKNPIFLKEDAKEQVAAINHVLSSKDFITIVAGGAGTGKTTAIKEVAEAIKEKGVSFGAFAPSAGASRGVQRQDGFKNATTIKRLLGSKELQNGLKDGMIWIDEAGMVGNKTMNQVIDIAKKQNARLLLTGDTKQHNSVERGDALRIIQEYGGVQAARINKIRRQKPNDYRQAIRLISDDKMEQGFNALDKMKSIKEAEDFNHLKNNIANEYVAAVKAKENTLLVATTHAQGKAATEAIREKLKAGGLLTKEKIIQVQKVLALTDPEKQDAANYQDNMTIQFHQNAKGGFKRGAKYNIMGKDNNGNVLIQDMKQKTTTLPLSLAKSFNVYEKQNLAIGINDKIRITQNGTSLEKKDLYNGDTLIVKGYTKNGDIIASSGRRTLTLDKNYRNLTHGYYTTSPASQGKSINRVIIMQGVASGKAASKEQFYVSTSRGKFAVSIHTDDKKQLLKSVQRSTQRNTALDIEAAQRKGIQMMLAAKHKFKKLGLIYRNTQSRVATASKRLALNPISNLFAKPLKTVPNVTRTARGISR